MFLLYLLFMVLAVAVFAVGRGRPRWVRLTAALIAFVVPSLATISWIAHVGDTAPADAITVQRAPK